MKLDPELSTATANATAEREDLNLRDHFATVRRRSRLVLLTSLIVFALVAGYTFKARRVFSSTTKVVVSTQKNGSQMGDVLGGMLNLEGSTTDTQREIIDSPNLIAEAYEGLTKKQKWEGWRDKVDAPLDMPLWTYDILSIKETDVILITTRSYDADVSAAFANAIAKTYLEGDRDRNSEAAKLGGNYVEQERNRTLVSLKKASQDLADYKKKTGMIAPTVQLEDAAYQAMTLRSELFSTQADDAAAQKRLTELNAEIKQTHPQIDAQTTLAENPEFAAVRDQVIALQMQVRQLAQEYKPGAPERQTAEQQLAEAESRLRNIATTSVLSTSTERNPVLDGLLEQAALAGADQIVAATKLAVLKDQTAKLGVELDAYPERERQYALLEQRVDVLKDSYGLLSERYYELIIEQRSAMPNAIVAASAQPAVKPTSPNVIRNLILGLAVAILLGIGAAYVADFFDTKMHGLEDVERVSGLPTLALVPEITAANSDDGNLYIGRATPANAFAESFRMLRNNLTFARVDRSTTIFAVSSSTAGEGKSTISVNLGIAIGLDGKRVLIIDVDLRKPSLHARMGVSRDVGLTNVVRGQVSLEQAIQPTEWQGVEALVSGPLPPDPSDFLNSDRMREVITDARTKYDYIILDSPPCIGLSDMQVVSQLADALILVIALEQLPKPLLMATLRMLRQVGAPLVGTVVNRVQASGKGYYGYYYYYGYGYGYGNYGYGYGSDYGEDNGDDKGKKRRRPGKKQKTTKD